MKVAFDSRPVADPRGIGRYARCLLEALRETRRAATSSSRRTARAASTSSTRRGSTARCCARACPQVVTLHDLVPLKRRSEYLRTGVRFRLRYLAVAARRAVIVPTEAVAQRRARAARRSTRARIAVIPEAAAPALRPRPADEVGAARARATACRTSTSSGSAASSTPTRASASRALADAPRDLPLVLVGPTSRGRTSCPT